MRNANKIRVLQVIHSMHIGGAENVVVDLATRADSDLVETEVCCINARGVLAERLEQAGVPVVMPRQARSYLGTARALKDLIRERDIDVVHSHGDVALCDLGPAYLLGRPAPWIHTYHFGNYPHIPRRYLYAQAFFSRFADQLIAVSEHQRQTIIKHMKVPARAIETILNGVGEHPQFARSEHIAHKRAELGLSPDDTVLGCIAVLSRQKGITHLLQAAPEMLRRHPELKILIVGGGPLLESLQQEARAAGLPDNVRFVGWRSDALEILPALDVFILPSLWEAMPIVLLEAMAAARPIVVTDVGDNGRIVEDGVTGRLIPPQNSAAIAATVGELLDDSALRARLGAQAYEYYRSKLGVDTMVRGYEARYRQLAGREAVVPLAAKAAGRQI